MSPKNNLTIFATYWNEKEWIKESLAQIDKLNPKEVIICDGCFDSSKDNFSTDGTKQIIDNWAKDRDHVKVISAYRKPKIIGLIKIFSTRLKLSNLPLRLILFFYYMKTNVYRINQAATFNIMSKLSKNWKNGNWFMNYDADQFYSDEVIENIKKYCNDQSVNIDLLTADEKTFLNDFNNYTEDYESRNYNNMPHRIKENTHIVPTRDIISEKYPKPKVYGKDPKTKKINIGNYFHYKFRPSDKQRDNSTYKLGDRKKPDTSKYVFKKLTEKHPSIIENSKCNFF